MCADAGPLPGRPASLSARHYAKLKPGRGQPAEDVAADQRARIHRAMVELVAERGYEAVKVTELACRARVSTRTFYERSHGKQECLLEAYDDVMRRAARRVCAATDGEPHPRRALAALAEAVVEEPQAARLVCLDASAAGLAVLGRMRDAEATFEAITARCLPDDPDALYLRPVVAKAIVAGLTQVFRSRLIAGREEELPALVDDLLHWTAGFARPDLARVTAADGTRADPAPAAAALNLTRPAEAFTDPLLGERELILAATLELAISDGYWRLTVPRIRAAAGLSRRRFDAHFEGVEDCFVAALESHFARLANFLRDQSAMDEDWRTGFHRGVASLCAYAASEPGLIRMALVEVFISGPQGLRHLIRLVAGTAERLRADAPVRHKPSPAIAEAAMGAVWGIVGDCVASGRPERLPQLAPILSFLALGPRSAVGASKRCSRQARATVQTGVPRPREARGETR